MLEWGQTAQSWAISCVLLTQSGLPPPLPLFFLSPWKYPSLSLTRSIISALCPALTFTAAIFPHRMQSGLKLYVSLPPMEFVHGEEQWKWGRGDFSVHSSAIHSLLLLLLQSLQPRRRAGCSRASAHLNRHKKKEKKRKGKRKKVCTVYTFNAQKWLPGSHFPTGRAHLRRIPACAFRCFTRRGKHSRPI